MFEEPGDSDKPLAEDQAFDVLQELERNTPEEIRRQRSHFRIAIKAGVTLQPGNASQLLDLKVKGVTGDISEGGMGALFPIPVRVGDIYRLQVDQDKVNLPLMFARCVRCRLVREGAYEGGFQFFAPIGLPDNVTEVAAASDD
jgi:c-di-GMP-binding flagellar brake protein YcgR